MYEVRLARDADEAAFRVVARRCLSLGLAPSALAFVADDEPALFPPLPAAAPAPAVAVPRAFGELAHDAICHRAPDRFALLYDVLWRTVQGDRALVGNPADPVVARLAGYAQAVRRDIHRMQSFLRFRPRAVGGRTLFVAWFEPQHGTLRRAVPFFVDRFATMDWLIATPGGTVAWVDRELAFGPPAAMPVRTGDAMLDELWPAYYRATFNPSRLRLATMRGHMPKRYWADLPETALIPALAAEAGGRVAAMGEVPPDEPRGRFAQAAARAAGIEEVRVDGLKAEIDACRRCPLWAPATQGVAGEGPADADLVFVGEQPGDQEDLAGRPFVGPAGQLFDRALAEAGIDRRRVYVTNAVKHFKFAPRGKRRIHQKPNAGEIAACRWWLDRELAMLQPRRVVALGATAASALAGRAVSVTRERGPMAFAAHAGFVTVHPSFLLRLPDEGRKAAEYRAFVADLARVRELATASAA